MTKQTREQRIRRKAEKLAKLTNDYPIDDVVAFALEHEKSLLRALRKKLKTLQHRASDTESQFQAGVFFSDIEEAFGIRQGESKK
jgi:hypothetical protein